MVISDVVICNNALNLLGVEKITALNENSRAANVLNTAYNLTKEALLRSHFWNFSLKRVVLTPDVTPPAFGYSYSFSLPSDALVWKFVDSYNTIKQEGRQLLSDEGSIKLIYVSNSTSEADFDPIFTKTLAIRIASDICYILTNNVSLNQKLEADFDKIIKEAKRMNAISQTPDGLIVNTFIEARM